MCRLTDEGVAAVGGDTARPVHDQRRSDTPFVREMLEPAERRTAERRPVHAQIQVRVRSTRAFAVEPPVGTGLRVGAVVREEQDHRVVEGAAGLRAP